MSRIRVTYYYEPDEVARDDAHDMGVTEAEFDRVTAAILSLGGEDIEMEKEY